MKKKLQVFISSTYLDLLEERQAAVEAILRAGHIPAGMELFAAGDRSQLDTIKHWIDESDVFMLILGGRYGSIDPDSGKSYIQLEYEYAITRNKRFFAVVLSEKAIEVKAKKKGLKVIDRDNADKLTSFRNAVTSKICRIAEDVKDIKISIHETIHELLREDTFDGWVSGKHLADYSELTGQVAQLTKENTDLRKQIQTAPLRGPYTDEDFETLSIVLDKEPLKYREPGKPIIQKSVLDWFTANQKSLISGVSNNHAMSNFDNFLFFRVCPTLSLYELTEDQKRTGVQWHTIKVSPKGKRFLVYLRSMEEAKQRKVSQTVEIKQGGADVAKQKEGGV